MKPFAIQHEMQAAEAEATTFANRLDQLRLHRLVNRPPRIAQHAKRGDRRAGARYRGRVAPRESAFRFAR